jgi:hypothetical protein
MGITDSIGVDCCAQHGRSETVSISSLTYFITDDLLIDFTQFVNDDTPALLVIKRSEKIELNKLFDAPLQLPIRRL